MYIISLLHYCTLHYCTLYYCKILYLLIRREFSNTLHELNTVTLEWRLLQPPQRAAPEDMPDRPSIRDKAAMVHYNNALWIFAGWGTRIVRTQHNSRVSFLWVDMVQIEFISLYAIYWDAISPVEFVLLWNVVGNLSILFTSRGKSYTISIFTRALWLIFRSLDQCSQYHAAKYRNSRTFCKNIPYLAA